MSDNDHEPRKPKAPPGKMDIEGDVANSVIIEGDGNVIAVNAKRAPSKRKPHPIKKPKGNVPVKVAWIGFFATILAALIALGSVFLDPRRGNGASGTATPTSTPTSKNTEAPTETAMTMPATDMPGLTSITPLPIGRDWLAGCISTVWQVYPSGVAPIDDGKGCWQDPLHAFSAKSGRLDIFYEDKVASPEVYGLFAELPASGSVTVTVRLKDLTNSDLWMGVFASPDLNSQGLLMTILNGPVDKRSIIQKDPQTYVTIQGSVVLPQGNGYSITFAFDSLYVTSRVNPSIFVVNPVSIPSSKKWLFLGYKGLKGSYRIEGSFLNFELKE